MEWVLKKKIAMDNLQIPGFQTTTIHIELINGHCGETTAIGTEIEESL